LESYNTYLRLTGTAIQPTLHLVGGSACRDAATAVPALPTWHSRQTRQHVVCTPSDVPPHRLASSGAAAACWLHQYTPTHSTSPSSQSSQAAAAQERPQHPDQGGVSCPCCHPHHTAAPPLTPHGCCYRHGAAAGWLRGGVVGATGPSGGSVVLVCWLRCCCCLPLLLPSNHGLASILQCQGQTRTHGGVGEGVKGWVRAVRRSGAGLAGTRNRV
jgi:hypothetical protein